jgi:membrane fusion protein
MFFVFFETTRKAPIEGMLVPTAGVIRIYSAQVGVIKEVRIKDGQFVREGDILFVVSSERSNADASSTEALISDLLVRRRDSFRTELQQAKVQAGHRRAALQQRTQDLQAEIKRLESQTLMQKQRIALSEQAVARFTQLEATNYISAAQLQEREAELLDQRQRLLEIERIRSATQRDLASAQAEEQDIAVQALRDENTLRRNASTLEQDLTENEARRKVPVRARQSGTVTAIAANLGQTVGTATSLASILPEGHKLEAEMYVPSRAVGFIKPGMTALLRYQAFPYQKFGQHTARVREVATTSVRPEELPTSAAALPGAAQSEPVYRVRLELDQQTVRAYGTAMPLRSGMLVDASVMLERRKLYEWVLEPLFSISGRL